MATDNLTPRTIEIPLTKGYVAIVDEQDADLALFKWNAVDFKHANSVYASGYTDTHKPNRLVTFIHIVIMRRMLGTPIPEGYQVDHENRNGLDNSRSNLRLATAAQNMMNKGLTSANQSGYKGVCFDHNTWKANIWVNGKSKHIGTYENAFDAAIAYNHAAKEHFGVFAYFNPIDGWELMQPIKREKPKTKSGYPHVMYRWQSKNWIARMTTNGKRTTLGYFKTPELAYQAYCEAIKE